MAVIRNFRLIYMVRQQNHSTHYFPTNELVAVVNRRFKPPNIRDEKSLARRKIPNSLKSSNSE